MLRKLIIVLAILTLSVSCSNLDNKNDQEQLVCGEAPGIYHALVHIDAVEDFDAILVKGDEVKRTVRTEKSCIAIAAEDREYRLLVRDAVSKTRTLHLDPDDIRPGLSSYSLTEDREGKRFQMRARCPAEEIQVSKDLEFFFKRSESDQVSYPMVRINVLNSQNATVLQTTRVLGDDVPSLPLNLPDGRYKLEMENFDAFDAQPADAGIPESCLLVIDRHKPEVVLKVERLKGFEDSGDTYTIAPASKLEFMVGQEEGANVSICLRKRQDEAVQSDVCELTEFTNVGSSYNAPGGGAWDLYAYARDKAGNQSGLKRFKLNIYQETVVAEVHALSNIISLMVRDNREYEAFKSLQKLLTAAKKLELKVELRDVYWQLLAHFHWAATKNSLIWEQMFDVWSFDRDTANHSLYEDAWGISGSSGSEESYIFRQRELIKIPRHYEEFQFLPEDGMVGIRPQNGRGMILEIFRAGQVVDSRLFDKFYEDVFIDHQSKVFVLVGSANLMLVNMENLDDQRSIELPVDANRYLHSGMELTTSPDSAYYYISFASIIMRVHINSGNVQIYEDPLCWIGKPAVAPNGQVFYTGYDQDPLYSKKNCQKAYKINWNRVTPTTDVILSPDEDYDSLTIININEMPFLVAFRSNHLDLFEFSTGKQYSIAVGPFASSARLVRHPIRGEVFYIQTIDTIYKMSLSNPGPLDGDRPFNLTSESIVVKGRLGRFFPTKDPGKILLVYDRKVQIRTFQPKKLDLLPKMIGGSFCRINKNGSHSLCLNGKYGLRRKSHLDGQEQSYQNSFEIAGWELLSDGEAILLSKNKEVYTWKPYEEYPQFLGKVELDGNVSLGWHPSAEVITVSHTLNRGIVANNSSMEQNPKTMIIGKKEGKWVILPQVFDGVPLVYTTLPVILIGRIDSNSVYCDVVDPFGAIINTMKAHTFDPPPSSKDFATLFLRFEARTLVLGSDPDLYSINDGSLRKFNVYSNIESPTPPIPDGYKVRSLVRPDSVRIESLDRKQTRLMNVKNGYITDPESNYSTAKLLEHWPVRVWQWGDGIMVEKTGEKLDLNVRDFFLTPDELVVGYQRYEESQFLHSIIRIDPDWMDAQLSRSLLYQLQRTELEPDILADQPDPSVLWN